MYKFQYSKKYWTIKSIFKGGSTTELTGKQGTLYPTIKKQETSNDLIGNSIVCVTLQIIIQDAV